MLYLICFFVIVISSIVVVFYAWYLHMQQQQQRKTPRLEERKWTRSNGHSSTPPRRRIIPKESPIANISTNWIPNRVVEETFSPRNMIRRVSHEREKGWGPLSASTPLYSQHKAPVSIAPPTNSLTLVSPTINAASTPSSVMPDTRIKRATTPPLNNGKRLKIQEDLLDKSHGESTKRKAAEESSFVSYNPSDAKRNRSEDPKNEENHLDGQQEPKKRKGPVLQKVLAVYMGPEKRPLDPQSENNQILRSPKSLKTSSSFVSLISPANSPRTSKKRRVQFTKVKNIPKGLVHSELEDDGDELISFLLKSAAEDDGTAVPPSGISNSKSDQQGETAPLSLPPATASSASPSSSQPTNPVLRFDLPTTPIAEPSKGLPSSTTTSSTTKSAEVTQAAALPAAASSSEGLFGKISGLPTLPNTTASPSSSASSSATIGFSTGSFSLSSVPVQSSAQSIQSVTLPSLSQGSSLSSQPFTSASSNAFGSATAAPSTVATVGSGASSSATQASGQSPAFSFGQSAQSSGQSSSAPSFGQSSSTPSFGQSSSTPSFGQSSSTPSFGQSSSAPSFGQSSSGQSSTFGFGLPSTSTSASVSSGSSSSTTANLGSVNAMSSGSTGSFVSPGFGVNNTSSGTAAQIPPSFGGVGTSASPFPASAQTAPSTVGVGPSSASSFGQTLSQATTLNFGPSTPTQVPSFGFGQSTQSSGQSSAPSFGQSSAFNFGQSTQSSGQSSTPSFAQSSTPNFGQSTQSSGQPSFAQSQPTLNFGQSTAQPTLNFGQPQQLPSTPSFGSPTASFVPSGPTSFGNTAPGSAFNFGAPTAVSPIVSSTQNQAVTFGSFDSPAPSTPTFSLGQTSGNPRKTVKPKSKRR